MTAPPTILNPYVAGRALDEDRAFFGREEMFQMVETEFRSPDRNAVVLFGQRRIGKTSILKQLKRRLGGQNCSECGREISRERMIELTKRGGVAALKPESRRRVSQTQRQHNAARQALNVSTSSSRITEETHVGKIQPRLATLTISAWGLTLGVSIS